MCHLLVFGLIIHHLQTLFHPPPPSYVPFVDLPGGEACQERWPSLHVKRHLRESWKDWHLLCGLPTDPLLCGLPHGLLCWLPCRLPPRTSINNQPNLLLWGKRLKPTCSTMNPKQEYHKVNLVHLFVVLSSCWTSISMISISLDVRKVQELLFRQNDYTMIVYDHMKHESWKQLNSLADWFNLIIFCKQ